MRAPAATKPADPLALLRTRRYLALLALAAILGALRAELSDQAALAGLVLRITGLGLEIVHLNLAAPPPAP